MTNPIQGDMISPDPENSDPLAGSPGHELGAFDPMWQLVKRLPKYARLSAALVRDPRLPVTSKAMLAAGGAYLVSPIDLVPGFIPVAGQLDDLYVLLLGLRQAMRVSPPEAIEEHFANVGLPSSIVEEDLAAIRAFVRQGVRWSLKQGGKALSRASGQAMAFAQRRIQGRNAFNDQTAL